MAGPLRGFILTLFWLASLAGCQPVENLESASSTPVEVAQEATSPVVASAVVAVRELIEPVAPPPPILIDGPSACPEAVALIIEFEIVNRAYYDRHLRWPIWPGAASGVTWGVGYDGGHQTSFRILEDWWMHEYKEELSRTAGITGTRARPVAQSMRHILTDFGLASQIFEVSTLPRYWAMTERAFSEGWQNLPACAKGTLLSVVYNRGNQMTGNNRLEMREIRDICVPAGDLVCISNQIRAMIRIWAGTDIENGMRRRRNAEADLVLKGINQ